MPQDVLPPEKKSIRRIPLASVKRPSRNYTSIDIELDPSDRPRQSSSNREESTRPEKPRKPSKTVRLIRNFDFSRYGVWIVVVVAIFVLVFGVSNFLTGATVTVTPRQKTVAVDLQGLSEKMPTTALAYDVATLGASQTTYIPSTGQSEVETKASGTIIVYNNYSNAAQRLIKNTRFETPEGLIYRIDHSIIVPGMTTQNGKKVPGSVETVVFADETGTKYNIGLTDFTIPGFKGDSRYSGFYARSKTSMTGGFVGKVPTASPEKLEAAYAAIEANLKKTLVEKLQAQTPENYLLFETAIKFNYERPQPTAGTGDMVAVTQYATSTAILFDREGFAAYVAGRTMPEYKREPIRIANLDSIAFTPQFSETFAAGDPLQFGLKGNVLFVWNFDKARLQNDLSGKAKNVVGAVLAQYSGIEKMEAVIRPFWKRTFPTESKRIKVEEKIIYPAYERKDE